MTDPNLNKIENLIKFNLLFSQYIIGNDLYNTSPSYILEKWDRYIGFRPTVKLLTSSCFLSSTNRDEDPNNIDLSDNKEEITFLPDTHLYRLDQFLSEYAKNFLMDYSEKWKFGEFYNSSMEGYDGLINILTYIFYTNRTKDLSNIYPFFEKYIGSLSNINPNIEGGIHKVLEVEVTSILEMNKSKIIVLLREMKLKELV